MSGYKRVNFYELCRLCASNQQKDKTHIFQEEGRKIQLQNKIASCLSLTVCENDFLPKVVCSQCLRCLEESYIFRKECVSSETMLSSYFNNFRYTEDFKKSGKVYIKDTCPKSAVMSESIVHTTLSSNSGQTISNLGSGLHQNDVGVLQENLPYYTLQLPTVSSNCGKMEKSKIINGTIGQPSVTYSLNTINLALNNAPIGSSILPKVNDDSKGPTNSTCSNTNGHILNVNLVDLETIIAQNGLHKHPTKHSQFNGQQVVQKVQKMSGTGEPLTKITENMLMDTSVVKVGMPQVSGGDYNFNATPSRYDKMPHIKNAAVSSKCVKSLIQPQSVILSQMQEMNNSPTRCFSTATVSNAAANLTSSMNSYVSNVSNKTLTNRGCLNLLEGQQMEFQISPLPQIACSKQSDSCNIGSDKTFNMAPVDTPRFSVVSNLGADMSNSNLIGNNAPNLSAVAHTSSVDTACSLSASNIGSVPTSATPTSTCPRVPNQRLPGQLSNTKVYVCDICQKTFKRREHLYQHVKLHTGFRPFTCESCNKSFMRKEHLLRHLTSHSGQKNFTCNICDKSFSRNDNLLKHKKTHDKQNSFACEVCQKQFVMKHYYLAHKLTHETEKLTQVWGLLKV